MAFINRAGKKYGLLTVLERAGSEASNGGATWKCVCDCGNEVVVSGSHLERGHTRSCGCLCFVNRVGKKYGLLTVLERAGSEASNGGATWKCVCDCGNKVVASGSHLERGHTRSCGCILPKHNRSGTKGVCWSEYEQKWRAYIEFNYIRKAKRFDTEQKAIDQRKAWEQKYHNM